MPNTTEEIAVILEAMAKEAKAGNATPWDVVQIQYADKSWHTASPCDVSVILAGNAYGVRLKPKEKKKLWLWAYRDSIVGWTISGNPYSTEEKLRMALRLSPDTQVKQTNVCIEVDDD